MWVTDVHPTFTSRPGRRYSLSLSQIELRPFSGQKSHEVLFMTTYSLRILYITICLILRPRGCPL